MLFFIIQITVTNKPLSLDSMFYDDDVDDDDSNNNYYYY